MNPAGLVAAIMRDVAGSRIARRPERCGGAPDRDIVGVGGSSSFATERATATGDDERFPAR